METRHSQMVVITKRLESANEKIDAIITQLGWTRQQLQQYLQDPIHKNHTISKKTSHTFIQKRK